MTLLPPFLQNAWRLEHDDEEQAKVADELKGWTPSSLAESHMKAQLDRHFSENNNSQLHSLSDIAVGSALDVLQESGDLAADARTIADSLSSTTLRQLLRDPRMPYQVLRVFDALTPAGKRMVDLDEAVQHNEHHIRSRDNQDGKFLVSLYDLYGIISETPTTFKQPLTFTRKNPPKGGLEVLDALRPKQLSINCNNVEYAQVFDRITNGILRGLDWSNVILAGGMAITTLLHVDPGKDTFPSIQDPDLNLYIYGLSPEDANIKAEEIHDVWARNLPPPVAPPSASDRLVVKDAKTIDLLTSYPNRRIRIVLKLLPTPTDLLLNFDLDICAIGFDGSRVFMLPRCARTIETGYSVFTMDLIWGHHLGARRESQDIRFFKYADRGFGIRFLPSYARSLESMLKQFQPSKAGIQRNRKPYGDEPGLKTLKRIAYLGQDYVHRFYFGISPLAISPKQMRDQLEAESGNIVGFENTNDTSLVEGLWRDAYEQAEQDLNSVKPLIMLSDLNTDAISDGRRVPGNLEIFMRYCEAWRLNSCAKADLDVACTSEIYDDIPTYDWNDHFQPAHLAHTIQTSNDEIWRTVKEAICAKLGIVPARMGGYAHYSTRRIRRQVCGPDLRSVQEKQITIPVNIPFGLENYLLSTLSQAYSDLPSHFVRFKPLIPVHDPTKYNSSTAVLPSLRDTGAETGNLRYWVITNQSMWAGQHRVLDEFAELMWAISDRFNQAMAESSVVGVNLLDDAALFCWGLARFFRCRNVLPEVFEDIATSSIFPSARESLLFRHWALRSPARPDREEDDYFEGPHELWDEEAVLYPFPNDLFWHPSDEGTWDNGEAVPEWTVPEENVDDNELEKGIYSYR